MDRWLGQQRSCRCGKTNALRANARPVPRSGNPGLSAGSQRLALQVPNYCLRLPHGRDRYIGRGPATKEPGARSDWAMGRTLAEPKRGGVDGPRDMQMFLSAVSLVKHGISM